MIIQHNISALNSYNKLANNNSSVSKNLSKLSSGYRINSAADDAAGLAISEKMRSQITGLDRAKLNAQDGISLVQTAEGALTEVHSMLNRLVELGTESANGTIQATDRQKIQDEVDQILEEVDRISQATNFNGINLLDGSLGSSKGNFSKTTDSLLEFTTTDATQGTMETGAGNGIVSDADAQKLKKVGDTIDLTVEFMANGKKSSITVSYTHNKDSQATAADVQKSLMEQLKGSALGSYFNISGDGTSTSGVDFTAKEAGANGGYITNINYALTNVNTSSGTVVSQGSTALTQTAGVDAFTTVGTTTAGSIASGDSDSDVKNKIFEINGQKFAFVADSAAADMLAKSYSDVNFINASAAAPTQSNIEDMAALVYQKTGFQATASGTDLIVFATGTASGAGKGLELQIGDTADKFNQVTVSVDDMSSNGLNLTGLKVTDQGISQDSIDRVNTAIEKVSVNRGKLGALQNRLEHTINNLSTTSENMTSAESRIRDTDMAKEMMNFTKNNVLVQAAQSMLAQANQQPQQVLQLLR